MHLMHSSLHLLSRTTPTFSTPSECRAVQSPSPLPQLSLFYFFYLSFNYVMVPPCRRSFSTAEEFYLPFQPDIVPPAATPALSHLLPRAESRRAHGRGRILIPRILFAASLSWHATRTRALDVSPLSLSGYSASSPD